MKSYDPPAPFDAVGIFRDGPCISLESTKEARVVTTIDPLPGFEKLYREVQGGVKAEVDTFLAAHI